MKKMILIVFILLIALSFCILFIYHRHNRSAWIIENIHYKVRDGFELEAFLLRPKEINGKYPVAVCFHHAWGNRDDYLKLFPSFAEAGIIAVSPNLPRQLPNLDPKRFLDLIDTLDYVEALSFVDKNKMGIVTSSLSVNNGAISITRKPNVIGAVMLSGPIMNEENRKWITINSDLALLIMVSKYERINSLLMQEYLQRSLNPLSKAIFIDNKEKTFKVEYHGTYLLDTYPESIPQIQNFFIQVFDIQNKANGHLDNPLPENTVFFNSSDGLPVSATFVLPENKRKNIPAVVLYPPRFKSRTYYDGLINNLLSQGIAVLAPNNKRTCRYQDTEFLCDREIEGALNFLNANNKIDKSRTAIVFPSAYFLAGKLLLINHKLPMKKVIFADDDINSSDIDPREIKNSYYKIIYSRKPTFDQILAVIKSEL